MSTLAMSGSDWNEAQQLQTLASIENIEKTLRRYGCGGGVVVVCLLLIGKSTKRLALVTPLWAILEDVKG